MGATAAVTARSTRPSKPPPVLLPGNRIAPSRVLVSLPFPARRRKRDRRKEITNQPQHAAAERLLVPQYGNTACGFSDPRYLSISGGSQLYDLFCVPRRRCHALLKCTMTLYLF